MKIKYTSHAMERMKLRQITDKMVEETIFNPEKISEGYSNRKLAYRTYKEGLLKIVYTEKQNEIIVISTIWEKRWKVWE